MAMLKVRHSSSHVRQLVRTSLEAAALFHEDPGSALQQCLKAQLVLPRHLWRELLRVRVLCCWKLDEPQCELQAWRCLAEVFGESEGFSNSTIAATCNLASCHIRLGQFEFALPLLFRLVEEIETNGDSKSPILATAYSNIAELLASRKEFGQAKNFHRKAIAI